LNRTKNEGINMESKSIALVAHDNRKKDLVEWVEWNYKDLLEHKLICTGTTGTMVENAIKNKVGKDSELKYEIKKLKSGPLGGDQQLGALIAEGNVDIIVFSGILWNLIHTTLM
jgi:methylglyoxal synthase